MTKRYLHQFVRGARPLGRAFAFVALAGLSGCFGSPEPLPPEQALQAAHERITRLLEEERAHYQDVLAVEASENPEDPSRIIFWYPAHPIIAPALGLPDNRADFGQAHPNIHLDAQFIGEWQVAIQKLTVSLAAGDVPDIAIVERSWAARLAQAGRIIPLDGFLSAKVLDDVHPHVRAAYTMQGRVWALPADGFCSVLFVNRDLVPNPPETWEDVRTLDTASKTRFAIGHLPYVEMLWSAGGEVCEFNQSGLAAPPALRTLEFLLHLRDTGQTDRRLLDNPAFGFAAFMNGDAALTAGSSEWLAQARDAAFPVDVAPVPGENGPISRLGDMAIVVFAKHAPAKREGIGAVLDFVTGAAVQGAEAAARGSVPVRQSVAQSVEIDPGLRAAYAVAKAPPFIGAWSAAEYELLSYLGLAYRWTPASEKAGDSAE